MSSLQQIFPFNNNLVRRFLNWKQGDEEDTWRNKAVDALIKKLKRQPGEQYSNLQLALNKKSVDTPCTTLPRSQDGRLQVSHRKMLPHVMYCRIFRWPDLQSQHELKSVPTCTFPATRRETNRICVNPYHYIRTEHPIYPPVVTPRDTQFTNASPPQSPLSPGSNYSSGAHYQGSSPTYFSTASTLQLTSIPQPSHQSHIFQTPPAHQQENPNDPMNYSRIQHQIQHQPQLGTTHTYYPSQSPLSDANCWYGGTNGAGLNGECTPPPGYTRHDHQQQQMALMTMDTVEESQQTNTTFSGSEDGPEHWCRITYAELNQKIGEPFKGSSPQVIVDGFTDPSVHNRRFSLGVLSNINRNSTIEMTRRAIRKGVCLENNDAQIYVKNLSESSIFFHSKNCNVENQLNQHAVVKIEPQVRQKIFDQKVFENLVQEAMRCPDGRTYERLFSLTEHCMIKMSFVKGWGSIYQRQDVTSTPCWIEIHLLKPYALIDRHLQEVRAPSNNITSTS